MNTGRGFSDVNQCNGTERTASRDRQLILNAPLTAMKGSKGKNVLELASMYYEYSHAPSNV